MLDEIDTDRTAIFWGDALPALGDTVAPARFGLSVGVSQRGSWENGGAGCLRTTWRHRRW